MAVSEAGSEPPPKAWKQLYDGADLRAAVGVEQITHEYLSSPPPVNERGEVVADEAAARTQLQGLLDRARGGA
jgi:hypothetical protein